jgi:hypothetical protein
VHAAHEPRPAPSHDHIDGRSRSAIRAFHRASPERAGAILRDGFRDAEGTWGLSEPHSGVWVTIEHPWDPATGGLSNRGAPELLVIEMPEDLFTEYEWVQEDLGYREALIPAESLNRYPVWRGCECSCGAIEPEGSAGWRSEMLETGERLSSCPVGTLDVGR